MNEGILSLLTRQVKARPDAVAVELEGSTVTFRQLLNETEMLCAFFKARSLRGGDRVAFLAKNCTEFAAALFACAKSGLVFLPLNFRLGPSEISFILADAEPACAMASTELAGTMDAAIGQASIAPERILVGGGEREGWASWREALAHGPCKEEQHHDIVVQMYTSGTTGRPKGAQLGHSGFLHLMSHAPITWGRWDSTDVNLIVAPLFHIGGTVLLLVAMTAGAKSVLKADFNPPEILESIEQDRITRAFLVPSMIKALIDSENNGRTDFSSLRQIVYAASPIPKAVQQQAMAVMGCDFAQVYGMTETTGAITYLAPEEHRGAAARLESCGRPTPGTEIRIVDAAGNPRPPGAVGEILIKTCQIMRGYWRRDDGPRETGRKEWFHSGDAGTLDAEGYLYVRDRIKDMVITGGENVYPAEVEAALITHPDVADVAVVGLPDDRWGEAVTAVAAPRAGRTLDLESLCAHGRLTLAGYKLPKRLVLMDELPRNASGKILKYKLRETLRSVGEGSRG